MFESLSQKSKNKKLFKLSKEENVFEKNKLSPMNKVLEKDYARYLGMHKQSKKPLYEGSSSKSSVGNKSITSSKKKTLRQAVLDSQWGENFSRRSNSNLLNRSYLREDPIGKASDITPIRPSRIVQTKRGSLKCGDDQRKFNVKDLRKVRTNRNSISMNTGNAPRVSRRNSRIKSTTSDDLKRSQPIPSFARTLPKKPR